MRGNGNGRAEKYGIKNRKMGINGHWMASDEAKGYE